jgi:hypothetical protein
MMRTFSSSVRKLAFIGEEGSNRKTVIPHRHVMIPLIM